MSIARRIYDRSKPVLRDIRSDAAAFCDRIETDDERGLITYLFRDGSCLLASQFTPYVLVDGQQVKSKVI